ncbi:MAG: DUF512 domain-containing protein [Clostridia bacterium]|nr:DUF512 domain-containing protein [Clostridia bacterium]
MVTVQSVKKRSPAEKCGIKSGDKLISVNSHPINDILDYGFYTREKLLEIEIESEGALRHITMKKSEDADTGMEFESFLMDKKRSCANRCIFCFIDQLPKGMRDTLYFKDDDTRLSFLQGNYVTLTNVSDRDISRILEMHISPVNVSVHTTNPQLRVKMLGNKNASKIMDQLNTLASHNISLNCQIVLCKGYNDKEELDRSMKELYALYPALSGVSIVPVGLTDYRDGLCQLEPFTKDEALETVRQIEAFGDKCRQETGFRLFYAGDEFYLKAGLSIPAEEEYDDYPQIENGVGLIRSMQTEFDLELDDIQQYEKELLDVRRSISVATGEAAYDFICGLVEKLKKSCYNMDIKVYKVKNTFFGSNVTVAGLITGHDYIKTLSGKPLGEVLYIPSCSLRSGEDVFLDDITLGELEQKLNVKIIPLSNDGSEFLRELLKQ